MAQAGLHGIVGAVVRKWMPKREWLMLGMVLGNLFPDMDNIAVAIATLTHHSTDGLHRTFTHSIFTVLAAVAVFYVIGAVTKSPRWQGFGYGFGVGILMHILLDLVVWFAGVEVLWPIPYDLNFWSWFVLPDWLNRILLTAEFLAFGLFFLVLSALAVKQKTDETESSKLRVYAIVQIVLFVLFTVLAFTLKAGFLTITGAVYLLSLFFAFGVSIRMKKTIETV